MPFDSEIPIEIKEKLALASAQAYVTNQMYLQIMKDDKPRYIDEYVEDMKRAYLLAKSELEF